MLFGRCWRLFYAAGKDYVKMQKLTDEEKAKIAKAAYLKRYRQQHKERQKAYEQKYWAKRYDEEHEAGDEHDR